MSRNVNKVENDFSAEGGSDLITIHRKEYEKLKYERDEYRSIALEFKNAMPDIFKTQKNITQGLKDMRSVIK